MGVIRTIKRVYKDLTKCRHKWECVNLLEANRGYRPIYKCKKCGEYMK